MTKAAKRKRGKEEIVIGNRKTLVEHKQIDNPYFTPDHRESESNPKKILAAVNMRESISAHWLHKDMIDEADYKASTDLRRWYEAMGGKGAGAIDYSIPKVDGGGASEPINLRAMEAGKKLAEIHSLIGQEGWMIVEVLCCQCVPLKDAYPGKYEQNKKSSTCRQLLVRIAEYLGYKGRGIRSIRA